ncbi:hypothetical protein D9615_001622 [Tricholomella constricta]|uniref:FYVE-type domain-containing protein n=1 Tax=Tricholomella constricta TaxID=117010 RepID=A0A8H5HPD9_9AGAR|nr:hypothetical protein D9615_001622 [Tricholomella constricta]
MSDLPYQAYRSKRHSHNPSKEKVPLSSPLAAQILNPEPVHDLPSPIFREHNGTRLEPDVPLEMHSSPAGPSASDAKPLPPPVKKASTFRRVPLRSARPSIPSSPLGPNHPSPSHSPNVSISSINLLPSQDTATRSPPVRADRLSRHTSTTSVDRQSPRVPFYEPSDERRAVSSPEPPTPPVIHLTNSTSSTPGTNTPTPKDSPPPSRQSTQRTQAPYRPGFQPKGLYRPLTDDFIALRRVKRDGEGADGRGPGMKRVERTKLLRRLEKLIDLHFPPPSADISASAGRDKRRPGMGRASELNRRASSFFDFDIRNMSISDAGGLWRGVVGGGEANDIRTAEQRITPWQNDADVAKCPLCSTSFHPLTNRKHHCRLCGQIICSLPVKRPHRPVLCSLLFVIDPKTQRIEEVGEGVDYGVRRRRVDNGELGDAAKGDHVEEEKFLKGVRICRTCRPILLRQQYQQEIVHVPTIAKLYETLNEKSKKPYRSFKNSHNDQPTKEASATRKRILEAFAQYDGLAKRIRKLPCPNGPGSSQDRVQTSIMIRASLFLQKNMFPLQSLPAPKKPAPQITKKPCPSEDVGHHLDPDSKMALALQPLLEQEALLESFVEEAKAQRKFEDVKTLKTNLREIRAEIEKIVANAQGGMQDNTNVQ